MRTRITRTLIAGCLALSLPVAAGALTITLQPDRDNTIYSGSGDFSNGAGSNVFAGLTGVGRETRALIRFDIAGSLPVGAQVASATLSLHLNRTLSESVVVDAHRLLADWGEGSSSAGAGEGAGAPPTPGDATWRHRFYDTTFWSSEGGDYAAQPSASAAVGSTVAWIDWSSPALGAEVQGFVDDPATNFGWILRTDGGAKRFGARGSVDAPLLTIEYAIPEPTPAALMAFALAAWSGLRRR